MQNNARHYRLIDALISPTPRNEDISFCDHYLQACAFMLIYCKILIRAMTIYPAMETQATLITYILEAILLGEEVAMVATRVAGSCQQDINGDGALFCYACASLMDANYQKAHYPIYCLLSR